MNKPNLSSLDSVVKKLLDDLNNDNKKYIFIFAHNGTGKTRLSMEFKDYSRKLNLPSDTLYYNAFTEDLFTWDNDLENDENRYLKMNSEAKFIEGIKEGYNFEKSLREKLRYYVDIDFSIDYDNWKISFFREVTNNENSDNIKISRGEENIFIWCLFLVIVELALDVTFETYSWVKFLYIDDPISSLDDNNAIAVATHLCELLKNKKNSRDLKIIISSHHALFFNVIYNELKNEFIGKDKKGNKIKAYNSYYLDKIKDNNDYTLKSTNQTPFFHHVALLKYLNDIVISGNLRTYHYNILRNILEKTALFLGYDHFSLLLDENKNLYKRMLDIFSHGTFSLYDSEEMSEENKKHFSTILDNFMKKYHFNPEIFKKIDSPNRN